MATRSKVALAGIVLVLIAISVLLGINAYQRAAGTPTTESLQPVVVSPTRSVPTLIPITPGTDAALAVQSGCLECHGMDQTIIGPSFGAIAARYKGDDRARSALVEIVKHGGKGNWIEVSGGVPMPPYSPVLSDAEIEQLVDWLLDL